MSKNTRKRCPLEFKHEAVRLVTDKGYKIAEATRSLDINSNMLCRWVRAIHQANDEDYGSRCVSKAL